MLTLGLVLLVIGVAVLAFAHREAGLILALVGAVLLIVAALGGVEL